jgi:hypothetical protein
MTDAAPDRWVSTHMTYGTTYTNTWDSLHEAASFLVSGQEDCTHACVSITRPDGSIEWDRDSDESDESIYDVLERAPEPPKTIVIPAQMMADVQCLGCGMLLVTAATRVGMNSKQNVGPHLCGGELIPAFQLTVRTEPARTMLAPTADLDDPEQADG